MKFVKLVCTFYIWHCITSRVEGGFLVQQKNCYVILQLLFLAKKFQRDGIVILERRRVTCSQKRLNSLDLILIVRNF